MTTLDQFLHQLQVLFDTNDYDAAKRMLVEGREHGGFSLHAQAQLAHILGRIYFYEGDLSEARHYFVECLTRNPADVYSKIYLARITEQSEDKFSALKLYAESLGEQAPFSYLGSQMRTIASQLAWTDAELAGIFARRGETQQRCVSRPKFSILILGYNKAEYTRRCLEAVFRNTSPASYEVIVVDNASVDETPGMLEAYGPRIRFVHSNTNLGFVGGNNVAAQYAAGDYIVFLNNDTEVQPGWLSEIQSCFVHHPRAGAVGSMLVYPNGVLQEAGGVIFNDASGWNYGRNENPNSSRFRFAREVDYCSGAALCIKADIFRRLGGFDMRFAPAYYEDTDLCFSVRKLGYSVMYCPTSKVVHHEGITAGTDVNAGVKAFQVINAPKFREKWAHELQRQYPCDPQRRYQFSNRKRGKRVLIIDDLPPLPDRAAGSLRLYHTVKQMLALGFQVTYVHLTARGLDETAVKHIDEFRSAGVEFVWFEYEQWWEIRNTPMVKPYLERLVASLELRLRALDLVYICFWHIAGYFIDLIRQALPDVPVIVDSMDLHYLREARQADVLNDASLRKAAQQTKKSELEVYAKADCVTTVTESDRALIQRVLPGKAVLIMTDVHDPVPTQAAFASRKDFLFVGNFNHAPNEDAVLYFVDAIFPLIKKALPEARFWIVGNNPTPRTKALASDDVLVTGWVPAIRPYLEQCSVSVVPLRFGAGNKGKVGEALAHGLPIVTTTIGAEGMNIVHGEHAFVADDPAEFARYAVQLSTDKTTWEKFSRQGKQLISAQYSAGFMRKRIEYLTSFTGRPAFSSYRALRYGTPPNASIIILTHNQFSYTRQCLESIREYTHVNHETIVVDNASTDDTVRKIEKHFPEVRLIKNDSNLGFPAGVNQGLNAALGEYIVLLNNDTVLTEGWLERLIEVAESDPAIGIVGPTSNYVRGAQIDLNAKYNAVEEMHEYARQVRQDKKGQVSTAPCVAFLCTLIKRRVIDVIGGLDERFSPGNFEDDDFCLRSAIGGFTTVIAHDVFIHHYGSKSFLAQGAEQYQERLTLNGKVFEQKWGVDREVMWSGQDVQVKKRSITFPVHRDEFVQHFERAQLHLEEKEIPLALAALEKALAAYHTSARHETTIEYSLVLDLAGHVALMAGELQRARQYFEEELRLTPSGSSACAGLGEVFYLAEMDSAAKTMFEHALVNDEENEEAKRGLAKVNRSLGLADDDNALLNTNEHAGASEHTTCEQEIS